MDQSVGVCIVNYRNWPEVTDTIESVRGQTVRPSTFVVVDNASLDGSAEHLRTYSDAYEVLVSESNQGYAAGVNLGLRRLLQAGCEFCIVLTHEVLLADNVIEDLVEAQLNQSDVALCGPLLACRDDPTIVWSAGGTTAGKAWHLGQRGAGAPLQDWVEKPSEIVPWLDGSVLAIRSAAIRKEGFLDESYFLYFEETDFAYTLGRAGYAICCVHSAVAWVRPGGHVTPQLWQRNRLKLVSKHARRRALLYALVQDTAQILGLLLRPSTRREGRARLNGLKAFAAGREGPL